jgi:hypothetical protein
MYFMGKPDSLSTGEPKAGVFSGGARGGGIGRAIHENRSSPRNFYNYRSFLLTPVAAADIFYKHRRRFRQAGPTTTHGVWERVGKGSSR